MNKLEKNQLNKSEEVINSPEDAQAINDAKAIIENIDNNYLVKKKLKSDWKILVIVIIAFIFLAFLFSTIFALFRINKNTIVEGVFINNIDVSNLNFKEATAKVNEVFDKNLSKELTLKYGDYSTIITPAQLNASYDISAAVDSAYSIGRASNIFVNNYDILNSLLANTKIKASISFDSDLLNSLIKQINIDIPGAVVQPDYSIDGTTLKISNGKDGVVVDSQTLIENVLYAFCNIDSENAIIDIPVQKVSAKKINIEDIYKDIHKEAVDAYYTTNPYVVYPSATGIDFKISMEEAKNIVSTPQNEYSIPLKVLYPKVTTKQIGNEAFPDMLSDFSTSFVTSNYNRSTNIVLASNEINGFVLMPGETFSYNQVVGQRTPARGFKEAPAYLNGKVVQEYGGGICQVSSTLYNAVLYANLEIVDRANHAFKPSYVDPGLDATVSWGGPDFKFKNNRSYPIKILCNTDNKKLYIAIYSLKSNNDLKVELRADYLSTVPAQTVYQTDKSLSPGQTRVIQSASNGCKTATYKILYDANGNVVSNECISRDTYSPHNKIIAVGR